MKSLRKQAEAISREQSAISPEALAAMSPEATRLMMHELHVHQIELEMQNDELRQSQLALDTSFARYFDLYDLAPVGYCTLSKSGQILQTNLLTSTLLGAARSALVGKLLSRFLVKEDANSYHLHLKQLLENAEPQTCELRIVNSDGKPFWVQLATSVGQEEDGATVLRVVLIDIDKRKQAEAALQKSEAFNSAIIDSLDAEIAVVDREGRIIAVNQSWRRFFSKNVVKTGQSESAITVGANYLEACQAVSGSKKANALNLHDGIQAVINGRLLKFSLDYPFHSAEQQRWFCMRVTPLGDGAVIAHTNITQLKLAENALREQLEFFHLIAENIGDFIAVFDSHGQQLYNSPSYVKFFGDTNAMDGSNAYAKTHPEDRERLKQIFRETVQTGEGRQTHYRILMANGDIREMESAGSVIRDNQGQVERVLVVSRDVTERKLVEDQVRQLAFHDALTKLPNRRLLNDRLSQAVAASNRRAHFAALMFLDLDNFKQLNDVHGHAVGDLLLVQVADRLKACVREMDTVARFGGDEFVVMISELDADHKESMAQAGLIAEKVRATLATPYLLTVSSEGLPDTHIEYRCTASIGVALFANHHSSKDILKWADSAMYQAKATGRNAIRLVDTKN
ncbi:MAG: GGDEF domain-containing protein [Formivibrio sp.]|nr:GGDEF domain-containing protein [Formivibrio sp.]